MDKKRLRDILCACIIMLMLPCSAYVIRGMSMPYGTSFMPQDSTASASVAALTDTLRQDTLPDTLDIPDSLGGQQLLSDSLAMPDSLAMADSLNVPDSLALPDSLAVPDSLAAGADSTFVSDTTAADTVVLTKRDLRIMARDSARRVRDSLKSVRDSIRWSKPRILETGFLPDSLYYERMLSWTTGTYINEYRHADIDTTFNDWYTEYPFYKEDIDAVYLGTIGSAVQNVNFFRRREFDMFKAFAPYITYSHVPDNMPFFNTKAPYTELAYWGTIFAYKDKEELNVRFMHTQNITPEWNLAILFQGWKAAGMLNREATANNSLEVTTNYLGKNYIMNAGFIHQNITREENGGVQDSYMVRDTTVDAKTIAVNLQNAQNKLSRNTFFISQSYNISLKGRHRKAEADEMPEDTTGNSLYIQDSVSVAVDSASTADSVFVADTAAAGGIPPVSADSVSAVAGDSIGHQLPLPEDTLASRDMPVGGAKGGKGRSAAGGAGTAGPMNMHGTGGAAARSGGPAAKSGDAQPGPVAEAGADTTGAAVDSAAVNDGLGDGPMLTVGHVGEISRYYRYYTDEISESDEIGRNFYNNMFYINPTESADSSRMFTVDNKLFFKLQPWARDAVVSEISGGLGYQFNSIYAFRPDMFLTGNYNVHQNNMYVYAGAGGEYKKYLQWGANAQYSFLGYYQNDFNVDAHVDISFYPFKDKTEPITLSGRFNTSLKEPDWYSQHYYSNHYVWDNSFGKTSTTKVEASLDIPKWRMEAFFGYALVNNYIYNDTLGTVRQHSGLLNVMSAYVRKDFKVWWFHLDNQALFQYSSDESVLPLPMFTFRMKYYIEIEAVKNVLTVQLGADARFNTLYYAPAYNPALGTFQLQTREMLGNNPYIDVFVNMQWKRVNVFLKVINVGEGWPDGGMMFSAYHYIKPTMGFKVGIHWPFYIE